MPEKLIPGEKKTPIYKKSSGFKMKGFSGFGNSPIKNDNKPTRKEKKEYKEFLDTVYEGKDDLKKEKKEYFKHYKKTGRKEAPPGVE